MKANYLRNSILIGMQKSVADKLARRAGKPDSGGGELEHHEARGGDVQDNLGAADDGDQDGGAQHQGVLSLSITIVTTITLRCSVWPRTTRRPRPAASP